jgi:hypothetical protein
MPKITGTNAGGASLGEPRSSAPAPAPSPVLADEAGSETSSPADTSSSPARLCSICREPGHNKLSCPQAETLAED